MEQVLLIEDDDRIRLSLTLGLEHEGYAVHAAATAQQGLIVQRRRPADMVLVDLMLPDATGLRASASYLAAIRAGCCLAGSCWSGSGRIRTLTGGSLTCTSAGSGRRSKPTRRRRRTW